MTGRRLVPGYGGSCGGTPGTVMPLAERVTRGAVRLEPGAEFDGTVIATFNALSPGEYRVGAPLRGWPRTADGLTDFGKLGVPFVEGELTSSIRVTLVGR